MHKFILGLALFFTTVALAGTDPSNSFRLGDGNPALDKKILINQGTAPYPSLKWNAASGTLQFSNDGTTFSDLGSGSGSGQGFNVLVNPDFESGILQGWTNSGGTFSAVSAGANLLLGKGSATFLATTTGQFVASAAYIIPNGLTNRSCSVGMLYKGGSTNLVLQAFDGTNVIATRTLQAVTNATPILVPFQCPASGTMQLRVRATGSSAIIAMDQMFLGQSVVSQVSQATFVGGSTIQGSNYGTNSLTFVDLPQSGQTIQLYGQAVADPNQFPGGVKLNTVQPGHYMLLATGNFAVASGSASAYFRCSDGNNPSNEVGRMLFNSAPQVGAMTMICSFDYTVPQGPTTFRLQAKVDTPGANASINVDSSSVTMSVYRFPTQTEQAVLPETINWLINASNTYTTSLTIPAGGPNDLQYTGSGANPLVNYGTLPAMQSCTSPTPSTGTTCVGVNNDVGIAFDLPAVQTVEACVTFNQIFNGIGAEQNVQYTVAETPDTALTVLQSSKYDPIIDFALGSGTANFYFPVEHCSIFPFTSAGVKHLRLFTTKSAGSAVIYVNPNVDNAIFNWRVKPLTQNVPAPILVGQPVAFRIAGVPVNAVSNVPTVAIWSSLGFSGYDTNNGYNTSTGEYTIPPGGAGLWFLNCSLQINQTAGTDYSYYIDITQLGTGVYSAGQVFFDATVTQSRTRTPKTNGTVYLNSGDKIICRSAVNVSGTYVGDTTNTFFEGHLIRN